MHDWHQVVDDRGETCLISFDGKTPAKPAFTDGTPALTGFIILPDGDIFRSWWPVFTEWFV